MPELPEVEITARRLDGALRGATIEGALAPGINALKTYDPALAELAGREILGVRRRGKHLIVEVEGPSRPDGAPLSESPQTLALLIHLMSAGRLQLYDKRAGPRDRTSRLLVQVRLAENGGTEAELRLREFGSKQAAWVKLLRGEELEREEALATLGPEAWPDPGDPVQLKSLLDAPRPLHTMLRDQRTIAGIGRSWVDEILWEARLSPYKRGADLEPEEARRLREAIVGTLGAALEYYERTISLPIPDRLPMPLRVHRHEGEPCPRCGETLRAVHFEDYVIAYCPACQTEGKVLKDRRLSRLLK
ncbi:MAG TPA: DNA-formamidopyrimidine glycosylase family protein [Solirubrobacteraceae bacterium]|jgi:formamidopyrimidine-DNA glycosylase|nr:DNA-formamidopyrimidine glycosylase family protein [Solirubrobacteraceae bacterium]